MEETKDQRDRDRSRRGDRPSRFTDGMKNDRPRDRRSKENRIYVSNIPYDYRWGEVKDLFREHVGDVAYVELFNDENDKPRGCGIVEFSTPESVKKAMEIMHRFPLQGRKLVIKEDFGDERDRFGHVIKSGSRDNSDRQGDRMIRNDRGHEGSITFDADQFNTYGLSIQFLESIGVRGPLLNKVFVANLDYKVDKSKLKEIFKMAGKVESIDLSTDKEGNSRGFAIIEYDHPVEAVQAISMFDKQILFERKLTVRMDRATNDKIDLRLPEGLKGIGIGLGPNGEPLRDVARNVPQNANSTASLGNGILGAMPTSPLSLNNLNTAALGNAALGGGSLGGLNALSLSSLGSIQNQILQQASNEILNAGSQLSNTNLSLPGLVGNGSMGFNRPSIGSANFQQSNMVRNQGNMGFSNQQPPDSMFGNNRLRDSDMMQSNNQKSMDTVFISNLPSTIAWPLLREKFSEAGEIKFADKPGKDTAVITFQNEWGASRAIKMFDRTRIDGRTIDVRYH